MLKTPSFKDPREIPLVHVQGLLFLLMVFDHCIHGYALNWAPFWFIRDFDRVAFLDGVYLFNQAVIMPGLFLTFGATVLRDLKAKGSVAYLKTLLWRYGVPTLIGVVIIVPLLSYPKYVSFEDPSLGFWSYWRDVWFQKKFQFGPFWVMLSLAFNSLVLCLLYRFAPKVIKAIERLCERFVQKPLLLIWVFMLAVLVYTISDLIWGAPWWIKLFGFIPVQGSKFLMNSVFFLLGHGVFHVLSQSQNPLKRFHNNLWIWCLGIVGLGVSYALFSVSYHEAAYDPAITRALRSGLAFEDLWGIFINHAGLVIIRTILLGLLVPTQLICLLILGDRFLRLPHQILSPLAKASWGIFIFHEAIVVWGQYLLTSITIPITLKILIIFVSALMMSWFLTVSLMKTNIGKRILGLHE